jgi:hypothetical protein
MNNFKARSTDYYDSESIEERIKNFINNYYEHKYKKYKAKYMFLK